jgi:hypothetical protein
MPLSRIAARASFHLSRLLPAPAQWRRRARRPFFRTFHDLLNREGEITLGQLVDVSGRQTYGLLILLLSLPSLIPGLNVGAAPVGGLALMAIGAQLVMGVPHPKIPEKLRQQRLHKGRIKEALARFERILDRTRLRGSRHRALNQGWAGILVFWTAFLLALPVPLPFANIAPALVLCLIGAALLEERLAWGWIGAVGSFAVTVYFALSFEGVLHALHRAFLTMRHWLS